MSWEKYRKVQNYFIPIEKEVIKIDKDSNKSVVTISYKIKFIGSARYMATSLSTLLIISQKEFTKLHVKIVIVFLNMKLSKKIQ